MQFSRCSSTSFSVSYDKDEPDDAIEYEFKDDIKPYVEFLETLYVLKVLVKVNSFCLQEKIIKMS